MTEPREFNQITNDALEVESTNATDLASALTLVNEIKTNYNLLRLSYNELLFKQRNAL